MSFYETNRDLTKKQYAILANKSIPTEYFQAALGLFQKGTEKFDWGNYVLRRYKSKKVAS